ncbi:MAG: hypothetical protein WKF71_11230 [Pyrinomonadaceae bacterium]
MEGTIGVLTFGDYATLAFNLSEKGANKNWRLTETASGVIKDGRIDLAQLGAGNIAGDSQASLKVSGTVANGKLSLLFEPLSSGGNDKSQTRGKIEAVKAR